MVEAISTWGGFGLLAQMRSREEKILTHSKTFTKAGEKKCGRRAIATERRRLLGFSALTCGLLAAKEKGDTDALAEFFQQESQKKGKRKKKVQFFSAEDELEIQQEIEGGSGATWLIEREGGEATLLQIADLSQTDADYAERGPYEVKRISGIEFEFDTSLLEDVEGELTIQVEAAYPDVQRTSTNTTNSSEVFPLAIFTSGFKVDASQYRSYAEHLASWGYVVLTYDKMEKLSSSLTDLNCAKVITELVSWAASNQLFSLPLSPEGVYLCGHSKGAKVSVLAAAQDPRVAALCLIDPVDNTVYAPLSPGYPSAVAALAAGEGSERGMEGENERGSLTLAVSLPTLVVGAAMAGDCAPLNANFRRFSRAASAPSWEVVLLEAAHLQFLDRAPILQSAICGTGIAKDANIGAAARAVMAAWGELTVKGKAKPCWSDSNRFFIENTEKYGNSHLEACQAVAAIQGITWKLGQTNAVVSRVKF